MREGSLKLLSKWDLLPLFLLACLGTVFVFLSLRSGSDFANILVWPGRAVWMTIIFAMVAWAVISIMLLVMRVDGPAFVIGRVIMATGALLIGLVLCLRPTFGKATEGIAFGLAGFTPLIYLTVTLIKSHHSHSEPIELLEDDPTLLDKYWKCGIWYFNPGDKRFVVPARDTYLGDNFSNKVFNCANKKIWVLFLPALLGVINLLIIRFSLF